MARAWQVACLAALLCGAAAAFPALHFGLSLGAFSAADAALMASALQAVVPKGGRSWPPKSVLLSGRSWLPDSPTPTRPGHPSIGTKVTVLRGYRSGGGRTVVPVQAVFSGASGESEAAKLAGLLQ